MFVKVQTRHQKMFSSQKSKEYRWIKYSIKQQNFSNPISKCTHPSTPYEARIPNNYQ